MTTACSHPTSNPPGQSTVTTTVGTPRIGWIDSPLRPGIRLELARTIPTSIRSAPMCRASQLVIRANANPGAGTVYAELYVTNTSRETCSLAGEPPVELVGPTGQLVAHTLNPTSSGSGMVLVSGSSVRLPLGGISSDFFPRPCPQVSRVMMDLGTRGVVSASTASTAPDQNPVGCSAVSELQEQPLSVIDAARAPNQIARVVLRVPATAQAGRNLDYLALVYLTAATPVGPDFFALCPIYQEKLVVGAIRRPEYYLLNCVPLGGVKNQPWVIFGMRISVPANLRPGTRMRLIWTAVEPRGPSATATLTISR